VKWVKIQSLSQPGIEHRVFSVVVWDRARPMIGYTNRMIAVEVYQKFLWHMDNGGHPIARRWYAASRIER
jgi:hypothetical protein